jgi:ElaB/YqjD/DUF883 family membrane-anchored ribosome-binding protein
MSEAKQFQQASQDFAADLTALRDDISKLTNSVSSLLRARASTASDQVYSTYNQARDHLGERVVDAREQFSNRATEAQERLGSLGSEVEGKIERNPLTAVVVAAIAGLLMGLLSRSF